MNLFEMQAIAGGISQKEYCKQLGTIMANCDLDNGAKKVPSMHGISIVHKLLTPSRYFIWRR